MIKKLFSHHILFLIFTCNIITATPIIIDHDGDIDDIIATTLQLFYNPKRIKAITIVPADCYALPAAWITSQLQQEFVSTPLDILTGVGKNEGINKFPEDWRQNSWRLARLPLWHNQESLKKYSLKKITSAVSVLESTLRTSSVPVQIVATGPTTNIADVLRVHPELAKKIERIFIMGGALYVKGNVEEPGHDGSAEWNMYNNPQAFKELLSSGVAITLIPLDATQYTPIRKEFINKIAQHQHLKQFKLLHEGLKLVQQLIDDGQYFFWDTLTSATLINPNIVKTKKVTINIITAGPSMGRTVEDKNGFPIDVAIWADQQLFEDTVFNILLRKSQALKENV